MKYHSSFIERELEILFTKYFKKKKDVNQPHVYTNTLPKPHIQEERLWAHVPRSPSFCSPGTVVKEGKILTTGDVDTFFSSENGDRVYKKKKNSAIIRPLLS